MRPGKPRGVWEGLLLHERCMRGKTGIRKSEMEPRHLLLLLTLTLGLGLGILRWSGTGLTLLLVNELEELERSLLGGVDLLADGLGLNVGITVKTLGGELLSLLDENVELLLLLGRELVAELLHGLGGLGADRVGSVGLLNDSLACLVGLGELLSVGNHLLDLSVAETRTGRDGHGLVLVGGLVEGRDVHDTIGVNVKGDLDLGDTLGRRGNTGKLEVAEQLVVSDKLTLTLVDLDVDGSLTISSGGEDLALLGGDGGVTVDESGEDTTKSLDTERERGNIEQENVGDLTGKNTTLNGGTDSDSLVGVDTLAWVTLEDALDGLENLGHSAHTTDHDDLLNVGGLAASISKGLLAWLDGAVDELANKAFELSTGDLGVDVLGTGGIGSDVWQANVGLLGAGELNLGLLGSLTDTLDGHAVLGEIEARLLLELVDEVLDKDNVKVLTTEVSVTVGGLDLKDTLLHLKNRNIEGTSSQVEDGNYGRVVAVETVSEGSSGGLVDDTENVKTGNGTSILGSLSLRVVEVSGNSDDGVLDALSKVTGSGLLHLSNNERTDLGGRVLLTSNLEPCIAVGVWDNLEGNVVQVLLDFLVLELSADETLGCEKGSLGVHNSLSLGWQTNETLAILGESNNGGGGSATFRVLNDTGLLALHDGDT